MCVPLYSNNIFDRAILHFIIIYIIRIYMQTSSYIFIYHPTPNAIIGFVI